jgi:hypothetical protein
MARLDEFADLRFQAEAGTDTARNIRVVAWGDLPTVVGKVRCPRSPSNGVSGVCAFMCALV